MTHPYHFGFVIEQSMGHTTHMQNLKQIICHEADIDSAWIPVPLDDQDQWQGISNLSLRLSLRSRSLVRAMQRQRPLDSVLFHTQLMTLFSLGLMRQIPTVISLDATPANFDTISDAYEAKTPQRLLRQLKSKWYKKVFHNASALITFSQWVKQSLEHDYQVDPAKIFVVPPGVDVQKWSPVAPNLQTSRLRLLFVGRDFERKGGAVLLEAFRHLSQFCALDIVTTDPTIQPDNSVRIHRGLAPNSQELRQLFATADIFVFPTFGDTNAFVVLEAMASGLPVITTTVGALTEEVEEGVTGHLVQPNDPGAIVQAVKALARDPERRVAMGAAGRQAVERRFNAELNAKAVVEVMKWATKKKHVLRA